MEIEYIVQTPFYTQGFWSLVLHCETDETKTHAPSRISGIIHADKNVNLDGIFKEVRTLKTKYGRHPLLLPLQLFITHFSMTVEKVNSIVNDVASVEKNLLEELSPDYKHKNAGERYKKLSKTLHQCSMDLAELDRRKMFEQDLGKLIEEQLGNDINPANGENTEDEKEGLHQEVSLFMGMAGSRNLDIAALPGRIESLKNVVSSPCAF